jgi:pimeloyl-ACP methyl ester carboxylesterase
VRTLMKTPLFGIAAVITLAFGAAGGGEQQFARHEHDYTGVFRFAAGETLVVAYVDDLKTLVMLNLKSGEVRALQPLGNDGFSYGQKALVATPVAGELRFVRAQDGYMMGVERRAGQEGLSVAKKVPMRSREVRWKNGEAASLSGTLLLPAGEGPFAVAVVLHGAGPETRWSSFNVALPLIDRGVGALIYDKRNSGESTGAPLPSSFYESSLALTQDAIAAVEFVKAQPEVNPAQVGVIGWSQGGWIGSIVAAKEPSVAFYVNVAGNASPGFGNWRHTLMVSMMDAGFSDSDIAAANRYLAAFFDVAEGSVPWERYQEALAAAKGQAWFPRFAKVSNTSAWDSAEQAHARWSDERRNEPASDFSRVHIPTLAIYFGLDESTTPESASVFRSAMERAHNPDFKVVEFPGLDHGGWEVPRRTHRIQEIDKTNPALYSFMSGWVADHVAARRQH